MHQLHILSTYLYQNTNDGDATFSIEDDNLTTPISPNLSIDSNGDLIQK